MVGSCLSKKLEPIVQIKDISGSLKAQLTESQGLEDDHLSSNGSSAAGGGIGRFTNKTIDCSGLVSGGCGGLGLDSWNVSSGRGLLSFQGSPPGQDCMDFFPKRKHIIIGRDSC